MPQSKRHIKKEILGGISAVVFDMDGLLLDTEIISFRVFNEVISEFGLEIRLENFADFVGLTKKDFKEDLEIKFAELKDIDETVNTFYKRVEKELYRTTPDLKDGALELIKYLHLKDIPIAVATSTYAKLAKKLLSETKLLNYFDSVVTGDMVDNGKPCPEIFLKTLKRLDVEPKKTIILEDSANGIRAANASGAKPILIPDLKMPSNQMQVLATAIYPSLVNFLHEIKKES